MKSIVLLLVLVTTGLDAQSYLQIRRGNAADRPTLRVGEPAFDRDSLDMWMGSDSGNVLIGGRSVVYGKATFAKDAGSTDAYAITLVPTLPNYYNGLHVRFMANTANTGTATLNINSLGAKTIYKGPLVSDVLSTGDIAADQMVEVVYSDSAFFSIGINGTDPTYNFVQVPQYAMALATSSWGASLNDSITVFAVTLPRAIKLGSAAVTTGTLGGSCSARTFSIAVYNSSLALVDYIAATNNPGNGTGGGAAFTSSAIAGPGLVYVAFSTYNDGTCTQQFRAADVSSNTIASGIIAIQNATYPIFGYATAKLTNGGSWPATITLSKSTTTTLYPHIFIAGTNLD